MVVEFPFTVHCMIRCIFTCVIHQKIELRLYSTTAGNVQTAIAIRKMDACVSPELKDRDSSLQLPTLSLSSCLSPCTHANVRIYIGLCANHIFSAHICV